MSHLMQNTSSLIIIIISTGSSIFREIPVSVIWARNNRVGAWHGVEKGAAVGAVAVDVCAGDLWGCSLHAFDFVVDGADGGFFGGGFEPGGEVVGAGCGCGVGD
jgi:hypothetical protein